MLNSSVSKHNEPLYFILYQIKISFIFRFSDTYSTFFRQCDSFSAGKCSPEDGTFIGNKPLNNEESCQDGCSIDVRCQDYTFDPIAPLSEQCKWYTDTYRQSCSLYAGNRVSLNKVSLSNSNVGFIEEKLNTFCKVHVLMMCLNYIVRR